MNCDVNREIVSDLLPLYLAGEASAATRSLVEAFLREDAELALRVQAQAATIAALPFRGPLRSDAELRTIRRTRRALHLRGTILGIAIFLSLVPFSIEGDQHGARWAWGDYPLGAVIFGGAAVLAWAAYFRLRRRLRAAGV
jgi:hypothetical protein